MNIRPNFEDIESAVEFNNWYWTKEELIIICKSLGITTVGRKNALRKCIIDKMLGSTEQVKRNKPSSDFNWAKETLTLKTIITDSVTFGLNFRKFMTSHIQGFVCNAEFMEWVKQHLGKTLEDAVQQYPIILDNIEKGKKIDKSSFNVMNAYLVAFLADNPTLTRKNAMACWNKKKFMLAPDGLVQYECEDLQYL